jgi:hypothetical protein
MRVVADGGGLGRDDSWLYCSLCHYLGLLMGCEYTLRLALERNDLVVSFRGIVGVDYLDLGDAFVECGTHSTHHGLDNERCSAFGVEHGSDVVWATFFAAVGVHVGAAERYYEMLAVHYLDYLIQHQERGRFVDAGLGPAYGDAADDADASAGYARGLIDAYDGPG